MTTTATPSETLGTAALTREIDRLRRQIKTDDETHETNRRKLKADIVDLERRRALQLQGLTDEDRELAESVIFVRGKLTEDAEGAFTSALTVLAEGGGKMIDRYVGVKRYERFHQREDHSYGYGPKHGSIVMAIGLQDVVRKRSPMAENGGAQFLEENEREACVRYLMARRQAEADGTWTETPRRDVDF